MPTLAREEGVSLRWVKTVDFEVYVGGEPMNHG
jgi:hypothetical protein